MNIRSMRQLKIKFENIKRSSRKDASRERQGRIGTGGGPPPAPVSGTTDWLRGLIPESIDGLNSQYDDDQLPSTSQMDSDTVPVVVIAQEESEPTEIPCSSLEKSKVMEILEEHDDDVVFDSQTPSALVRKPMSTPLKGMRKPTTPQQLRSTLNLMTKIKSMAREQRVAALENVKDHKNEVHALKVFNLKEQSKEETERHLMEMNILKLKQEKLALERVHVERIIGMLKT